MKRLIMVLGIPVKLVGFEPAHLLLLVNTSGFSFQGLNRPENPKAAWRKRKKEVRRIARGVTQGQSWWVRALRPG